MGVLINSYAVAAPGGGSFDFAGLFTKGAFNVDDLTGLSDGTRTAWEDASALGVDFSFDPGYGSGTLPVFKTNIVSGKPVLRCTAPDHFARTLPAPIAQPLALLWVGRMVTAGAALLINNSGAIIMTLGGGLTNYIRINAGNASGGLCADLAVGFHYALAILDGASSVLRVDSTNVTFDGGSPGTNSMQSETFLPPASVECDLRAYGLAPIHPSAGQITAIEAFAASLL